MKEMIYNSDIWKSDLFQVNIRIGRETVTLEAEGGVTLCDLKRLAREKGIKRFSLSPEDVHFPIYEGEIEIIPLELEDTCVVKEG